MHNEVDPSSSRRRLLDAAFEEFTAHGLAGARVDRIVKRAGVNPRMLYHFFGSKDGLFEALLKEKLTSAEQSRAEAPKSWADMLEFFQRDQAKDLPWIRLLLWEALEYDERGVVNESDRAAGWRRVVEQIVALQAAGQFPRDLDAAQFELSLVALVTFPVAFPQFSRLITGMDPRSEAFIEGRVAFLRRLAGLFEPGERANDREPDDEPLTP